MKRTLKAITMAIKCLLLGVFIVSVSTPAEAAPQGPGPGGNADTRLRNKLKSRGITELDPGPDVSPELSALGEALFFDKELGGNRDMACATCHFPTFGTGDALSLSIGTGGIGLGDVRDLGLGNFIPRNAPEIFNRGAPQWASQFWDSRIEIDKHGTLITPAGAALPPGIETVLAAQAMFPVTSRHEMRGEVGESELGDIPDGNLQAIWDALMVRLLSFVGYQDLFAAAYPDVAEVDLGFQHAANAIAGWEMDVMTLLGSPFDQYLAGDNNALTDQEKAGAAIFVGTGKCANCHAGPLLTDQAHYNIGVPQLGPGKGGEAPLDNGRFRENGKRKDLFAFRVPPLRNVALTGPYMHDGAYVDLEDAVRHHLDPTKALLTYDKTQLRVELQGLVQDDPVTLTSILATLDLRGRPIRLSDAEISDLMAFLNALTDPAALDLSDTIPDSVPSGLPVDGSS